MSILPGRPPGIGIRLRPRSVSARLVVLNIAALAVLLSALGFVAHLLVRSYMMRSVDRDLARRTDRLADRPMWFGPPIDGMGGPPNPGLGDLRPRPGPFSDRRPMQEPGHGQPDEPPQPADAQAIDGRPRVFDLKGRSLEPAGFGAKLDEDGFAAASLGMATFTTVRVSDQPFRVLSRPFPRRGPHTGVVQAAYPLTEVNRAVAQLDRALLLLAPIALLIAGLGGYLLTHRVLSPVRSLTQAAGRIGAHDLSERLAVMGDDEFADLSATFNEMLARLELSFQEQAHLVDRLQHLVEQQTRFTADASHELRTPLTIVKANASLLRDAGASIEDYRDAMADIEQATDDMSRLVDSLLVLARADEGRLGRDTAELPVREVLTDAVRRSRRSGSAPSTVVVEPDDLCVEGNQDELVRLFANLLDNAQRHTPPEGAIAVTARSTDEGVSISVADTGCGIAAEHVPHLGERFYRADVSRTRPTGGTGLGLSICKSIAAAHGGSVIVESEEGKGTTVTCTLPRSHRAPDSVHE